MPKLVFSPSSLHRVLHLSSPTALLLLIPDEAHTFETGGQFSCPLHIWSIYTCGVFTQIFLPPFGMVSEAPDLFPIAKCMLYSRVLFL